MLSDTTNVPYLFVRHPDWQVAFDMDVEKARAARRRMLDMAAAEGCRWPATTSPPPATS